MAQVSLKKLLTKILEWIGNRNDNLPIDSSGNVTANGCIYGKVDYFGGLGGYSPADKTVATGASWKELYNFTLPSGIWLVTFAVQYTSNATGMRAISLGTETAAAGTIARTVRCQAANDGVITMSLTVPVPSGKYYINTYQTSGTSLTAQTRSTAVKIGTALGTDLRT